ncbi:MAG: hypothetical protein ACYCYP_09750 [Leptospirales bacterium]
MVRNKAAFVENSLKGERFFCLPLFRAWSSPMGQPQKPSPPLALSRFIPKDFLPRLPVKCSSVCKGQGDPVIQFSHRTLKGRLKPPLFFIVKKSGALAKILMA